MLREHIDIYTPCTWKLQHKWQTTVYTCFTGFWY